MFGNPMEIALLAVGAIVLFGANRIPEVARSLGRAKKEFAAGQAEAEVAAEHAHTEARAKAEADAAKPGEAPH